MAALKYWVWLTALPGLSNRSRLLLLERYGSPEDVYYADAEELALTEGLTPGQAQLLSDKSLTRADRILADCARGDIFLLTLQDAAYPARLPAAAAALSIENFIEASFSSMMPPTWVMRRMSCTQSGGEAMSSL